MRSVEFAQAWTRKLEALGVVLNNGIVLTNPARFSRDRSIHTQTVEGRKFTPLATRGSKHIEEESRASG